MSSEASKKEDITSTQAEATTSETGATNHPKKSQSKSVNEKTRSKPSTSQEPKPKTPEGISEANAGDAGIRKSSRDRKLCKLEKQGDVPEAGTTARKTSKERKAPSTAVAGRVPRSKSLKRSVTSPTAASASTSPPRRNEGSPAGEPRKRHPSKPRKRHPSKRATTPAGKTRPDASNTATKSGQKPTAADQTDAPTGNIRDKRFYSVCDSDRPCLEQIKRDTFSMMTEGGRQMVAVVGSGEYGLALGRRLERAGYHVLLVTRNPHKTRIRFSALGVDLPIVLPQISTIVLPATDTTTTVATTSDTTGDLVTPGTSLQSTSKQSDASSSKVAFNAATLLPIAAALDSVTKEATVATQGPHKVCSVPIIATLENIASTLGPIAATLETVAATLKPSFPYEEPETGVMELTSYEEGLARASLAVISVPSRHYCTLPHKLLARKILVDISNKEPNNRPEWVSNAEYLQRLVPSAAVVKSLNTVPAYSLQEHYAAILKQNPTCGDHPWAVSIVQQMLRMAGLPTTRWGALKEARTVEKAPLRFFSEATGAIYISTCVVTFYTILTLFRKQLCGLMFEDAWDTSTFNNFLHDNTSAVAAQSALTLLALTYLAGVLAGVLQLWRGTKYRAFPGFLDTWLKARKYLGLAALLLISLHAVCQLMKPLIYPSSDHLSGDDDTPWKMPTVGALGAIGLLILSVQGITSLPAISAQLSWSESQFLLSRLGWLAFLVGVTHITIIEWDDLFKWEFECYILPQGRHIVILLSVLTIAGKLVLLLPCVDAVLTSIRGGYDRVSTTTQQDNSTQPQAV